MAVEQELERLLVKTIVRRRGINSIGPDEDLIGSGIVDSLGLMELVSFIEQRYGVTIDDDEIVVENFRNIRRIEGLIEAKRSRVR
jgi:acyl carrier protein